MSAIEEIYEAAPEAAKLLDSVYEGIKNLNASQKRLLVNNALSGISHFTENPGPGSAGFVHGLTAVAGLAVTALAEEEGDTATSDKAVSEVIDTFRRAYAEIALSQLSPEEQEQSRKIVELIKQGATPEAAYEQITGRKPGALQATAESTYDNSGLYL